ncbi:MULTISPECIES: fumarylacetoacetate hydrolase family protein [Burkholderia cepacia complex]|uniref:5-carboxymethyl-2-hydroxymuconate Delta-isomerase n=2 Tax=Burkholderia cepacia complex TaxID=87882 RepID=A0A3R9C2F4_9BURK|nr:MULTISPECIES: fumarylacetoacetate hydrolase family protein [Burkholderia cepacia complex]ACA93574.1 5-carboxymethyl-2-hydroxymuconate Delta-isomerase [Burkholderia orbicola MC0-3]AWG29289.1 5-carboxymethyl-2-hydroxymuconate Delta-isomerase [Burkholderia cenocepacia]MBR8400244.1 fumarylacetoacetate hydrolase family protein [Burkholderia cenocepacia]MCA8089237.1 fumarylacetoacetate hydrolase family protein [Burkholderia cenocepacia]RSC20335.1 FAA hydrolase family protein [Burkholderia cenocep
MRFAIYKKNGHRGIAVEHSGQWFGLTAEDTAYPGDLDSLLAQGADLAEVAARLARGTPVDLDAVRVLPPFGRPNKILCVGLNYLDHSMETGFAKQTYPTVFARFASSLIGHDQPIALPAQSSQLDYEGELVAVIGKAGRGITRERALDHVAGYSLFNDVTLRDYQFRTPQWTMGKNFDGTGGFGPWFVTADELPRGCKGLRIQTRLNGAVVQEASTSDMIFDIETLVVMLSEVMTLQAGDLIVTGTPAGIGMAREPQLWMKAGDVCEVEIEQLGVLRNAVMPAAMVRCDA